MASFNLNVDNGTLVNLIKCTICYDIPKPSRFLVCEKCRNVVCKNCLQIVHNACPFRCGIKFVNDKNLTALAELIDSKASYDGRPLDCEGGRSHPGANEQHSLNYEKAREDQEIKAKNAQKIFDIEEKAGIFYACLKRKLLGKLLKDQIESDVAEEGNRFSSVAEDIQRADTGEAAGRVVRETKYFSKPVGRLVREVEKSLPEFQTNLVSLAYVLGCNDDVTDLQLLHHQHTGALENCTRCLPQLRAFFHRFYCLSSEKILEFARTDLRENREAPEKITRRETSFLRFYCYLESTVRSECEERMETLCELLYECNGSETRDSVLDVCKVLARTDLMEDDEEWVKLPQAVSPKRKIAVASTTPKKVPRTTTS